MKPSHTKNSPSLQSNKQAAIYPNNIPFNVFENLTEAVIVVTPEGNLLSANPAYYKISGFVASEIIGENIKEIWAEDHDSINFNKIWKRVLSGINWKGEISCRSKNAATFSLRFSVTNIKDKEGKTLAILGVGVDISQQKKSENKILHRATHDPLTGLPNRNLFIDRLRHCLQRAQRYNHLVALLFLDLDHFKTINDSLGHQAGDAVLVKFSKLITNCLRSGDTIARLGGDEFTVIMENIEKTEDAAEVAQKILNIFDQPFIIGSNEVYLGVSIGITLFPIDSMDQHELIKQADMAMYHAKEQGRNNFQFFTKEIHDELLKKITRNNELRNALGNGEFCLEYQPIIDLELGAIYGVEALLRWNRIGKEILHPHQFLPLAEEKGLLVPIGRWVIEQACKQIQIWEHQSNAPLFLSINLSLRQFHDRNIVKSIQEVLARTGVNPWKLCLELTESTIMNDVGYSIKAMMGIKTLGVQISMDDFGTGYSSFNYLKLFPIDTIKLDRTIIKHIPHNQDSSRMVAAIISLAKDLQLKVIAEGIETKEQLRFLLNNGCDKGQGFLFSNSVSPNKFEQLLLQHKPFYSYIEVAKSLQSN